MLEILCHSSNIKTARVWDIMYIKLKLGYELCDNLLFIHAFLGCDIWDWQRVGTENIFERLKFS